MMKIRSTILNIKPWVTIVHHIPGRLRLKFDANALDYINQLNTPGIKQSLDTFPALIQYRLNLVARCVVVEYDNHLLPPSLIDALFDDNNETFQRALAELERRSSTLNQQQEITQ